MREEVNRNVASNAFFIAEEKTVFQLGEPPAIHGKDDLIDYLGLQNIGESR